MGAGPGPRVSAVRRARSEGSGPATARDVVQWTRSRSRVPDPTPTAITANASKRGSRMRGSEGLGELVALDSYHGTRPGSTGAYAAAGRPPSTARRQWSAHPRGGALERAELQGRESARGAAILANAAEGVCAARGCEVLAGSFEDASGRPGVCARVRARARLPSPRVGGASVRVGGAIVTAVRALRASLPAAGAQLWITEVGALDCSRGARARRSASGRRCALPRGRAGPRPARAPAHVFDYGARFADGAACAVLVAGGRTRAVRPGGRPRAAAELGFPAAAAAVRSPSFGPGPGRSLAEPRAGVAEAASAAPTA